MLINPAIQEWFANLHGRPLLQGGGGGFARGGGILPNYGSEVLQGIVKPGSGMFGFNAPSINSPRFSPSPVAQGGGPRGMVGSPLQFEGIPGGSRDLGGAARAAGMAKLGAGIEKGAAGLKAGMDKANELAQIKASANAPLPPVRPLGAGNPTPTPPSRPEGFGTPTPTFPSIGSASDTPILAQSNVGTGPMGDSIGPGGALPTFAQGAGPATADNGPGFVNQFLTGLKTGEGVPYSGLSRTGAIGAYGLTGDFIRQYAPGAGLPSDRASYMNNPALQDQLAKYAATQMYNKYGSWPQVANAWLTGSPTATRSAPGNMSPAAYDAKVMNAANAAGSGPVTGANSPSSQAYAAMPPSTQQPATALAGPVPQGDSSQAVVPGQSDPHKPGFDPSSVPFINTPMPGDQQSMNEQPMRVAMNGGLPQNDTQPVPQNYNQLRNPEGLPYLGGNPQGQMPRPYQGGPDLGPQLPALPPTTGANTSMNDQGVNPLAAALAQNGQPMPQMDQSAMLAMALSQPDLTVPPPVDFGGEGGFGGGFGGGFLGGLFG